MHSCCRLLTVVIWEKNLWQKTAMMFKQLDQTALALSASSFATTIMHTTLMFYYVKVFLNLYGISEEWFQFTQAIFLVWNAVNDPLLGYIVDHVPCSVHKTRRHTILYGAPVFALSFLIPWFPCTWLVANRIASSVFIMSLRHNVYIRTADGWITQHRNIIRSQWKTPKKPVQHDGIVSGLGCDICMRIHLRWIRVFPQISSLLHCYCCVSMAISNVYRQKMPHTIWIATAKECFEW